MRQYWTILAVFAFAVLPAFGAEAGEIDNQLEPRTLDASSGETDRPEVQLHSEYPIELSLEFDAAPVIGQAVTATLEAYSTVGSMKGVEIEVVHGPELVTTLQHGRMDLDDGNTSSVDFQVAPLVDGVHELVIYARHDNAIGALEEQVRAFFDMENGAGVIYYDHLPISDYSIPIVEVESTDIPYLGSQS